MINTRKFWVPLAGLFLLGLGFRALSYKRAFHRGQVFFFGSDAWCHLRRIDYAANHRLALPEPDPMLNYPEGTFTYWGWLYDRLGALAVMAAGLPSGLARERFLAWYPAVLGALCVIPAFFLGALLISRGPPKAQTPKPKGQRIPESPQQPQDTFNVFAGIFSAFFVAVLPGHAEYTMLGHLDHHVMESLLFGCLAASFAARRIGLAALFLWLTYLQHPAISNLYAGLLWFLCMLESLRRNPLEKAWMPFAAVAVLMLPSAFYYFNVEPTGLLSSPVAQLPRWMLFQQYSFLQPVFLAFCSVTLWLVSHPGENRGPGLDSGFRRNDRIFFVLGILAVLGCAAFLILPVYKGLLVLLRADPLLKFTAESMPILFPHTGSGFKPVFAHQMFGWLFLAFPVWWVYAWRKNSKNFFFAGLCGLLFLFAMLQLRFVYLFSFAMALALAHAVQEIRNLDQINHRRLAWVALLVSFYPCVYWWQTLARGSRYRYLTISDSQYDTFSWLRHNTPAVKGFDNASEKPEWSILASWDQGHGIVYLGRKAVVSDPLNHGMKESIGYYSSIDPREASGILISKGVRYVMAMDLSEPVAQEMHAGSLELPPSHPLRTGDWLKLFQMRLLMNFPIAGPDGHPFYWGHHLVHLSDTGKDAVFEFKAEEISGFKPRIWKSPAPGVVVSVGKSIVTNQDIEDWKRTQSCYPNRSVSREQAFSHTMRQAILDEIFRAVKVPISQEDYRNERERIDRETRAPEILACIKKKMDGDMGRYERAYIRPLLSVRVLQELVAAQGWPSETEFFRATEKVSYRIYDSVLEAWIMTQNDAFLSALDHGST